MKKPTLQTTTQATPKWVQTVTEIIDVITGRAGDRLKPLAGPVALNTVAERVNDIIYLLQDTVDSERTALRAPKTLAPVPQAGDTNITQNVINNITQTVVQVVGDAQTFWTPAELAPALWLDAQDDSTFTFDPSFFTVAEWRDKSIHARHAAQAVQIRQPAQAFSTPNGLRSLRFDGVDDVLTFSEINNVQSVFMVMRWTDALGDFRPLLGHSTLFQWHGNTAASGQLHEDTFVNIHVAGARKFISGHELRQGTSNYGRYTSWEIVEFMCGGASVINNLATDRFLAGRFLKADVAEVLILDGSVAGNYDATGKLKDAIRQKVEGYLAWKWGLVERLPASNPYRLDGTDFGFPSSVVSLPRLADPIMNGGMDVVQRALPRSTSTTQANQDGRTFGPDRWHVFSSNQSQVAQINTATLLPSAAVEVGGLRYTKYASVTRGATWSPTGSDYVRLAHVIPTAQFIPFSRKGWTLQFAVRASVPGVYGVVISSASSSTTNRSLYVSAYEVVAANTWEVKQIAVPAMPPDIADLINTYQDRGISIIFCVRGAALIQKTGAWVPNYPNYLGVGVGDQADGLNSAGASFQITGVGMEHTVKPDASGTLVECMRFYQRSADYGVSPFDVSGTRYVHKYSAGATGSVEAAISYGVSMIEGVAPRLVTYKPGLSTVAQLNRLADNGTIAGLNTTTGRNGFAWSTSMTGFNDQGISFCWEVEAEPIV